MDTMQQSACLFVNQITVDDYGFLFYFTTEGQASDFMTVLTQSFNPFVYRNSIENLFKACR